MAFQKYLRQPKIVAHLFPDDGAIPNNPNLPLLVYQDGKRSGIISPAP